MDNDGGRVVCGDAMSWIGALFSTVTLFLKSSETSKYMSSFMTLHWLFTGICSIVLETNDILECFRGIVALAYRLSEAVVTLGLVQGSGRIV